MMLSPNARRACSVTAHADAGSTFSFLIVGNIEIEWKCADCNTPDETEAEEPMEPELEEPMEPEFDEPEPEPDFDEPEPDFDAPDQEDQDISDMDVSEEVIEPSLLDETLPADISLQETTYLRLNSKAGRGQLDLYLLIQLLGEEAALVTIQLDLLRMSVVTRRQRSQRTTGRLFRLWDQLLNEERTPRQLLRAASHLIPVPAEARFEENA